ncbi:MAG: toxin-antitoxin system HicB family antitoxin [Oscillatoria sp. PMC 1051.18]|nr:toxin-antitoxin system HicB family antitoxin [Oscillatoria sp. PMC 1050.18]MEC5031338.1 toxin-antitoxin system HicB family antitoxin [Oscillatoria sp. PMC 1051.18]
MSRLTLRLPETLHQELANLAQQEGISLNQYIVYALTRQVTLTSSLRQVSKDEVEKQISSFESLLESLGNVSVVEAKEILKSREMIESEEELSPKVIERFQQRISEE